MSISLLVGVAFTGAVVALVVWSLLPAPVAEAVLRGADVNRRRDALQKSAILRGLFPAVRVATYYSRFFPRSLRQRVTLALALAGHPGGLGTDEFLALTVVLALLGAAGAFLVGDLSDAGSGVFVVGAMVGLIGPHLWLSETGQQRLQAINRGLPQVLDLVVMSMGAGLDFVGSLRYVVSRWGDPKEPLREELNQILQELALGRTHSETLQAFAARAPSALVKECVASIVQAERRGTPMVDVLGVQAEVARTRRFQSAEKVANRAGVMLTVPVLICLASTLLILFGGVIVRAVRGQLM